MKKVIDVFLRLLFIACALFSLTSCDRNNEPEKLKHSNDFTIYLAKGDVYELSMDDLDDLQLEKEPFITINDIESYKWNTHSITFTDSAFDTKISAYTNLWKTGFVVSLGSERIYYGVFQAYIDSWGSQDPVIIVNPPHPAMDNGSITQQSITIQRNYFDFNSEQSGDDDPRKDQRIYSALKFHNKLID